MRFVARAFATFLFVGYLRPAPGTWGSLAGLIAGLGLVVLGGWMLLFLAALLVAMLGWLATSVYLEGTTDEDPSEVVIDEVAGIWVALLPVAYGWAATGDLQKITGIVAAFVLFRFLDILKPGPVGWADRLGGAFGVMFDDLLAGAGVAIVLAIPLLL
ncbi:MAG: phosphatidylglycerophosphatase A family protein [Shimia sp.]